MTSEAIVKKAFAEAEKEAVNKQVAEVKKIVQKTLEKLEDTRKKMTELRETERLLKLDIDDLKAGKLNLIAERQEKDQKAKETSVVVIIKETVVERDYGPWYWPYRVVWPGYVPPYVQPIVRYANNTQFSGLSLTSAVGAITDNNAPIETVNNFGLITCSVAKDAAIGHYDVADRSIDLR